MKLSRRQMLGLSLFGGIDLSLIIYSNILENKKIEAIKEDYLDLPRMEIYKQKNKDLMIGDSMVINCDWDVDKLIVIGANLKEIKEATKHAYEMQDKHYNTIYLMGGTAEGLFPINFNYKQHIEALEKVGKDMNRLIDEYGVNTYDKTIELYQGYSSLINYVKENYNFNNVKAFSPMIRNKLVAPTINALDILMCEGYRGEYCDINDFFFNRKGEPIDASYFADAFCHLNKKGFDKVKELIS